MHIVLIGELGCRRKFLGALLSKYILKLLELIELYVY